MKKLLPFIIIWGALTFYIGANPGQFSFLNSTGFETAFHKFCQNDFVLWTALILFGILAIFTQKSHIENNRESWFK